MLGVVARGDWYGWLLGVVAMARSRACHTGRARGYSDRGGGRGTGAGAVVGGTVAGVACKKIKIGVDGGGGGMVAGLAVGVAASGGGGGAVSRGGGRDGCGMLQRRE